MNNSDITKAKILLVDDNSINLQVLNSVLQKKGYVIYHAINGERAIELANSKLPDLILLDIMMPGMSGLKVCEILKANNKTKNIPIILLTVKSEPEDLVKGFKLGSVDYITKPFNQSELLARVENHLELKFAKDIILEQNKKLRKLNEEKNEFIGIAAHDLKNPLFSIKGFADIILNEAQSLSINEIKDFSGEIKLSAEQSLRIIYDLLDINKIEEGKIKLELDKFNINGLINRVMFTFSVQCDEKNIKIIFKDKETETIVHSDVDKVRQILDNLISNAIKFSPKGKQILISVHDCNKDNICIEVKDQGPGISEDDKKKLFTKFAKLSAKPTNNEISTGLGLSIVKKYAQMLNGDVWCDSVLGKGASFIFMLPKE